MKRVIVIVFMLISLNSYAQTKNQSYINFVKQETLTFDVGINVGCSFSYRTAMLDDFGEIITSSEKITPKLCLGAEVTVFGVLCGITSVSGGYKVNGYKDVYVSGYTRTQNGKSVNVNSYYRSRPGHKGGGSASLTEFYFGYWFPSVKIKSFTLYAAPIIGFGGIFTELKKEEQEQNLVDAISETRKVIYGAGLKLNYKYLSLSIKATNTSATLGVSLSMPRFL